MATPVQAAAPAQGASAPTWPAPTQATVSVSPATNALMIRLAPEPKPDPHLYENPTVVAATLAFVGVVITVAFTSWLRSRDLRHASALAKEERDHSRELANMEREAANQQANLERSHSSSEAQRARLMEARKEVYGGIIDDYLKVMAMLAALPQTDLKKDQSFVNPLQNFAANIHRTWLLSEVETAFLARELHSSVNELFFKLLAMTPPMQLRKDRIAAAQARREAARSDVARYAQAIEALIPRSDNVEFTRLRSAHELAGATIKVESQKIAEAQSEHEELARKFRAFLLPRSTQMLDEVQKFMYHARAELGLEADSELLKQQTVDIMRRVMEAAREFDEIVRKAQ